MESDQIRRTVVSGGEVASVSAGLGVTALGPPIERVLTTKPATAFKETGEGATEVAAGT